MLELRYYLAGDEESPFEEWFTDLDAPAAAKVSAALARLEQGNLSNVKGSATAFWNTGSIGGRATGCISDVTARYWLSC
jgi:hypothetical protein